LKFEILVAVSMDITVFQGWKLVVLEKGTSVSEEPAASTFRDLPSCMTSYPEDCILDHITSGNNMTKLN
jgi:hypothetical protein